MDIRMPVLDGIEATRQITADPALGGVRVVVLTTFDVDDYVYAAIRAGASGFLLKDARPEDVLDAIRVVADRGASCAELFDQRARFDEPGTRERIDGDLERMSPQATRTDR